MTTDDLNLPEMILRPVGVVRSDIKETLLVPTDQGLEIKERAEKIREYHQQIENLTSELVIEPELEELLEGIEDFSHVLVLYWPHLIPEERRSLRKVHPMGRADLPITGIFATCSPARPNPVLVSAVPLLERKRNILRVKGLEALDGSPVVDVKPYILDYYGVKNPTIAQWMRTIHKDLGIELQGGVQ